MTDATTDIRFSIIIPTCNRVDYLGDAVRSAIVAAPPRSELIIVNDGDPIPADHFAGLDFPITILPNSNAQGPAGARNAGVAAANGLWLLFLDDDDLALPGYWLALAETTLTDAALNDDLFGHSPVTEFSDRSQPPQTTAAPALTVASGTAQLSGLGCGFWISKRLFQAVGGIDESLRVNEDTDFCVSLLSFGAKAMRASTPGVSIFVGRHDSQAAGSVTKASDTPRRAAAFHYIIRKHADFLRQNSNLAGWLIGRYLKYQARVAPFRFGEITLPAGMMTTQARAKFAALSVAALLTKG